ncbi:uncharacterized protein LOC105162976 [Sesamum indicum]|uniref:Uncharacterized protein LOC105162976 n=1 Tax=Sesamum indicum TaxID=4182 RepID=A0A6I9TFE8_SESIN|nr:uncharacterized protein LOC105162976 [Sesamum indicum]
MEDREREEEEEKEAAVVADFVRNEVGDWDDEAKIRARFKALSGQRSDWSPLYSFWRDLILKVARHLHIFIIRPSRVKRLWFRRAGLSPLCLDHVLLEMHRAGDLLSPHPTSSTARLSHIFRRALDLFGASNDYSLPPGDYYILAPLLEEQALEVVNKLSENYWTTSCVITMRKFQDVCLGSREALAILGYLSAHDRARRLIVNRADPIEGVKVFLAPGAVSSDSSVDYTLLHLTWTAEKLEQQLDVIDKCYQKNSALASLKSGNKRVALRYAKELKMASQSRERCMALLDQVEKVLQVIADTESSKKVLEAMQSSKHALLENQISLEEVELCLQEVDDNIDSLKRLDDALGSKATYTEVDDEDIEGELSKLQLEIKSEMNQVMAETGFDRSTGPSEFSERTLSNGLSNLNLKEGLAMESEADCCLRPVGNKRMSKEGSLEAA